MLLSKAERAPNLVHKRRPHRKWQSVGKVPGGIYGHGGGELGGHPRNRGRCGMSPPGGHKGLTKHRPSSHDRPTNRRQAMPDHCNMSSCLAPESTTPVKRRPWLLWLLYICNPCRRSEQAKANLTKAVASTPKNTVDERVRHGLRPGLLVTCPDARLSTALLFLYFEMQVPE